MFPPCQTRGQVSPGDETRPLISVFLFIYLFLSFCALLSFCPQSYLHVLQKEFSVVRLQPGGIRRIIDKPPPRQLITLISSGAFY
jgi:hypothetical protein